MSITQKSIRSKMEAYVQNEAWGNPQEYDLVITRIGTKLEDTNYEVMANPKTDFDIEVDTSIDLDVWFKGGDPFKKDEVKDEPDF